MVSAFYAALASLLMCYLTLIVIGARRRNKVRYLDGGVEELIIARAAQANAAETIPIALILLFFMEYNGVNLWVVNGLGLSLVVGRVIHAHGMLTEKIKQRVLGMQITLFTMIGMAILNLFHAPYTKIFKLG